MNRCIFTIANNNISKLHSHISMDVYTMIYEDLSGKIAKEHVKEMDENKQSGYDQLVNVH